MIHVVLVGSLTALRRHFNALSPAHDVRIIGRWIVNGEQEAATDAENGIIASSPDLIIGNSDALIITGSSRFCRQLVTDALRKARHVYLYPSMLCSVDDAVKLPKLAREANVILKAGKTGFVNMAALTQSIPSLSEISLVDLQHYHSITDHCPREISEALQADLEIICSLINARVISIKAKGMSMISSQPEIINARLEFDNGCAVNYNCNLVAAQPEFRITLVLKNRILKYDFITGDLTTWLVNQSQQHDHNPLLIESVRLNKEYSLAAELSGFINLIRSGPAFLSIYDNGFESYLLADRIMDRVLKTLVKCP